MGQKSKAGNTERITSADRAGNAPWFGGVGAEPFGQSILGTGAHTAWVPPVASQLMDPLSGVSGLTLDDAAC